MRSQSLILAALTSLGVQTPDAEQAEQAARWRERLFFPEVRVDFQLRLSVEDVLGTTRLDPGERLEQAESRAEDGDVFARLDLALALLGVGERDRAKDEFDDLRGELAQRLERDREDWPTVAALGEVAANYGRAFRDTDALRAADGMLRASFARDDELWRAPATLGSLYIWLAIRAGASGAEDEMAKMLDASMEFAELSIASAPDELRPHAVLYMARTWSAAVEARGDAQANLRSSMESAEELLAAADLAESPELVEGLAGLVVTTAAVGACFESGDPREAFAQLDEDVRERLSSLGDDLVLLADHRLYAAQSTLTHWLLAWLQESDDEARLFEEALASGQATDVLIMKLGLELSAESWEASAELCASLLEESDELRTRLAVGHANARLGDLEQSTAHFEAALEHDGDSAEARVGLAIATLLLGGDADEADRSLEEFLDEAPDDHPAAPAARYARATALALAGEYAEALELLETCAEEASSKVVDDVRATLEEVRELAG